jgi:hypothetical protein
MARKKHHKQADTLSKSDSQKFRNFAETFSKEFTLLKDRVFFLLGPLANQESGIYREMLLRDFFSNILPRAVSVDTGFIYGCDKASNSRQMDIIIWNSSAYPSVFRASGFVIVPPESVIAVISVKSSLTNKHLKESLENISSIIPLDYMFRSSNGNETTGLPPIRKYMVFYEYESKVGTILNTVQHFYNQLYNQPNFIDVDRLLRSLRKYKRVSNGSDLLEAISASRRVFVSSIATINKGSEDNSKSDGNFMMFVEENTDVNRFENLPLLPYLYRQESNITSSFEKLVFDVLQAVSIAIGTRGWRSIHTWIAQDPITIDRHNTEELSQDKVALL